MSTLLRPRSLLGLGLLVALAAGPLASARAETLDDLAKSQQALSRRVEGWIRLANRDPREDEFETYRKYQPVDFAKGKNKIKAADIAAILADARPETAELRNRVFSFLKDAALTSPDPDLSTDKMNGRPARKAFAQKNVLPLLTKDDDKGGDRLSRFHANEILKAWFGAEVARDEKASKVVNEDFKVEDEKTWKAARAVWSDVLRS